LKIVKKITKAHFGTLIAEDVSLPGTWEVGLSEISIPKTWYNLEKSEEIMLLFYDYASNYGIKKSIIEEAWVPSNLYTMESLTDAINDGIKMHFSGNNLRLNPEIEMETFPSVNFNKNTNTFVLCKGR
jgi:hypothetical protein